MDGSKLEGRKVVTLTEMAKNLPSVSTGPQRYVFVRKYHKNTVKILNIGTDRPEQTADPDQTQQTAGSTL